jgi:hypothetical protein
MNSLKICVLVRNSGFYKRFCGRYSQSNIVVLRFGPFSDNVCTRQTGLSSMKDISINRALKDLSAGMSCASLRIIFMSVKRLQRTVFGMKEHQWGVIYLSPATKKGRRWLGCGNLLDVSASKFPHPSHQEELPSVRPYVAQESSVTVVSILARLWVFF